MQTCAPCCAWRRAPAQQMEVPKASTASSRDLNRQRMALVGLQSNQQQTASSFLAALLRRGLLEKLAPPVHLTVSDCHFALPAAYHKINGC